MLFRRYNRSGVNTIKENVWKINDKNILENLTILNVSFFWDFVSRYPIYKYLLYTNFCAQNHLFEAATLVATLSPGQH